MFSMDTSIFVKPISADFVIRANFEGNVYSVKIGKVNTWGCDQDDVVRQVAYEIFADCELCGIESFLVCAETKSGRRIATTTFVSKNTTSFALGYPADNPDLASLVPLSSLIEYTFE